jgi:hypothetical protein
VASVIVLQIKIADVAFADLYKCHPPIAGDRHSLAPRPISGQRVKSVVWRYYQFVEILGINNVNQHLTQSDNQIAIKAFSVPVDKEAPQCLVGDAFNFHSCNVTHYARNVK